MTVLLVAYGVASCLALAWTVLRLMRTPRSVPLWAITGLIASWAVSYPFDLAANAEVPFLGLAPMTSRLIQHVLLLFGVNSLACFYLFSARQARQARVRALWYALPLIAAVAVLVLAAVKTPAGAGTSDMAVPGVAVVYLTADAYLAFGFATACVWAWRYAQLAAIHLARGLRLAAVGLAAIVLANAAFIPSILLHLLAGHTRSAIAGVAQTLGWFGAVFLLLPGIVVFLTGVSYPALAQRLASLRIWRQHRRLYHELAPLWTALNDAFPQDRLERLPAYPWREVLSPLGVHRRFYRRVVECRDGLVRLSPYLAALNTRDNGDSANPTQLAEQLRDALRSYRGGEAAAPHAVPVALPPGDTLDADAHTLAVLSRALHQTQVVTP